MKAICKGYICARHKGNVIGQFNYRLLAKVPFGHLVKMAWYKDVQPIQLPFIAA